MISVIFSEFIIYLCVSILMGTFILTFVPNNYRPFIYVKKGILILATVGIALFSFMPILRLIFNLQGRIGWQKGFQTVLLTFDIGKAWIFTVFVVFLLLFFIKVLSFGSIKLFMDWMPFNLGAHFNPFLV